MRLEELPLGQVLQWGLSHVVLQGAWWHCEACGWVIECSRWGLGVLERVWRRQWWNVQLEAPALAGTLQQALDEPGAGLQQVTAACAYSTGPYSTSQCWGTVLTQPQHPSQAWPHL